MQTQLFVTPDVITPPNALHHEMDLPVDGHPATRFAHECILKVKPGNSGEWLDTPRGKKWRVGICSPGAFPDYIVITDFELNHGVAFYAYPPGFETILGTYSSRNNHQSRVLAIPPIAGDSVILELNVPGSTRSFGSLCIEKVYHDHLNLFGIKKGAPLKSSYRDFCQEWINYINTYSLINVSGNFFVGYEPAFVHPNDSLAIYHSPLQDTNRPSPFFLFDGKWKNTNSVSAIGTSITSSIGIIQCYGQIRRPEKMEIEAYPNPCNNFIHVEIPNGEAIWGYSCNDYSGQKVNVSLSSSEELHKFDFDLPSGINIIHIATQTSIYKIKFILNKC